MTLRIGQGFDAHPLITGRRCVLGGVEIPSEVGPDGHSDGDVVLHALCDALLGATAVGDLGTVFGTDRAEWKGASSASLLAETQRLIGVVSISNVDVSVIASRPKIGSFREAIRERLAELLQIAVARISVKASSGNGLTDFGRGEGIAALVVLLVDVPESS